MQEGTTKDLLSINRYKNLMRLVDTEYQKNIQALCRDVEMLHLSSFLNHQAMPNKLIGARMARNIEFKLNLPTRSLDASPGHQASFDVEHTEDCPVKIARFENLNLLLKLVSPGNISQFNDFLGCRVSNYLGAKRTRSVGDKMANKIEIRLGLSEGALDEVQSMGAFLKLLTEKQVLECIERFQSQYFQELSNLTQLNERQELTIDSMLQRLAIELTSTSEYELLPKEDVRKIFLPYADRKSCLPVLIRPNLKKHWDFWVIGIKGMKTLFDKVTKNALEGVHQHRTTLLHSSTLPKLSIIDPVNHNHDNLTDLTRDAELIIKRATYDLQDTVDEVLSLRASIKQSYNTLVEMQTYYLLNLTSWKISQIREHYSSGLQLPIIQIDLGDDHLEAILLPSMQNGAQTKEIKEFVRREVKRNSTLAVLPMQMSDLKQLGNKLISAKLWLRHS